jgi:hypothetical protein
MDLSYLNNLSLYNDQNNATNLSTPIDTSNTFAALNGLINNREIDSNFANLNGLINTGSILPENTTDLSTYSSINDLSNPIDFSYLNTLTNTGTPKDAQSYLDNYYGSGLTADNFESVLKSKSLEDMQKYATYYSQKKLTDNPNDPNYGAFNTAKPIGYYNGKLAYGTTDYVPAMGEYYTINPTGEPTAAFGSHGTSGGLFSSLANILSGGTYGAATGDWGGLKDTLAFINPGVVSARNVVDSHNIWDVVDAAFDPVTGPGLTSLLNQGGEAVNKVVPEVGKVIDVVAPIVGTVIGGYYGGSAAALGGKAAGEGVASKWNRRSNEQAVPPALITGAQALAAGLGEYLTGLYGISSGDQAFTDYASKQLSGVYGGTANPLGSAYNAGDLGLSTYTGATLPQFNVDPSLYTPTFNPFESYQMGGATTEPDYGTTISGSKPTYNEQYTSGNLGLGAYTGEGLSQFEVDPYLYTHGPNPASSYTFGKTEPSIMSKVGDFLKQTNLIKLLQGALPTETNSFTLPEAQTNGKASTYTEPAYLAKLPSAESSNKALNAGDVNALFDGTSFIPVNERIKKNYEETYYK